MVAQGHIDAEDFNGVSVSVMAGLDEVAVADGGKDPEMNKPGQKGIFARKKKTKQEDGDDQVCLLLPVIYSTPKGSLTA